MDWVLIVTIILSTAMFGVVPPYVIGKIMLKKSQKMLNEARRVPIITRQVAQEEVNKIREDLTAVRTDIEARIREIREDLETLREEIPTPEDLVNIIEKRGEETAKKTKAQIDGSVNAHKRHLTDMLEELATEAGHPPLNKGGGGKVGSDIVERTIGSFLEDYIPGAKKGDGAALLSMIFSGGGPSPNNPPIQQVPRISR